MMTLEQAEKIANKFGLSVYIYEHGSSTRPDRTDLGQLVMVVHSTTSPEPAPDHGRFEIEKATPGPSDVC